MNLSIIIISYNTCELLRACLASIASGCGALTYEIFVVDNHSHDDSVAMMQHDFPAVKIIANENNVGFGRANNQALKIASGEYFLLLNSDAELTPNAAADLVTFMNTHHEIGFCSGQLLNMNGTLQNTATPLPNLLTELLPKPLLRWLKPHQYCRKNFFDSGAEFYPVEAVVGAALMVRRKTAEAIGFYDEAYFFFFEETDWCLRARKNHWQIALIPAIKIFHRQGGSAKQTPISSRLEYWRSRYIYFRKHFSLPINLCLKIGLLAKNTVNLCLALPLAIFSHHARYRVRLATAIFKFHLTT